MIFSLLSSVLASLFLVDQGSEPVFLSSIMMLLLRQWVPENGGRI